MICTSCGKEFQNDMNFCPYCGVPVVRNEQPEQNYNNGQNYYQPPYNNGQNNWQQPYGNGQYYGNQQSPYGNGQYYGNQYPYGYSVPVSEDVPSAAFNALAFFFPLIGLIFYLVWKDETPKKAKAVGKWALISFSIGIGFFLLWIIRMLVLVFATDFSPVEFFI